MKAEPIEVLNLALVLYVNGKQDEAVFWYYAGLLRAHQQLLVEPGQEDAQHFVLTEGMTGTIIKTYARKDVLKLVRTIDDVQAWDARTPNRFIGPIKAQGLLAKSDGLLSGLNSMKANLIAEREAIEARAHASNVGNMIAELHKKKCSGGT